MTYTIIAHDPDSGAFGVGVQSHWFNVGRTVPWVRFGVGAVATQATTEPAYGWRGLDVMAAGVGAAGAMSVLVDDDPGRDGRQVAFVDAAGDVAVHTGSRCIPDAGHVVEDGWAVLGNLLAGPQVLEEMARGFRHASGTLAERMVSALEAAELAGGDVRGRQSAAIRIAPGPADMQHGREAGVEILIAEHPEPVAELRRLVEVDRSYRALSRATTAFEDGQIDVGLEHLDESGRLRHGGEVDFWRAVAMERVGRHDVAEQVMADVLVALPAFREVLERLARVDPDVTRLRDAMR